jgi:hypothetical protein
MDLCVIDTGRIENQKMVEPRRRLFMEKTSNRQIEFHIQGMT